MKKVLIVEDSPSNSTVLSIILKKYCKYDLDITFLLSPKKYKKQNKYDLIISDFNLPHENGIEFYNRLSKDQKDKFIFLTGYHLEEIDTKDIMVITKPITSKDVFEIVKLLE